MTEADCLLRQCDVARHLHEAGADTCFFDELLQPVHQQIDDAQDERQAN